MPTRQETWVQSLGWDDPLEKGMATHSSILSRKIPWTEEPGGVQSMGSQRVGHDWVTFTFTFFLNFQVDTVLGGGGWWWHCSPCYSDVPRSSREFIFCSFLNVMFYLHQESILGWYFKSFIIYNYQLCLLVLSITEKDGALSLGQGPPTQVWLSHPQCPPPAITEFMGVPGPSHSSLESWAARTQGTILRKPVPEMPMVNKY